MGHYSSSFLYATGTFWPSLLCPMDSTPEPIYCMPQLGLYDLRIFFFFQLKTPKQILRGKLHGQTSIGTCYIDYIYQNEQRSAVRAAEVCVPQSETKFSQYTSGKQRARYTLLYTQVTSYTNTQIIINAYYYVSSRHSLTTR